MAKKVKVIVLRTAGTNCDKETAFVFQSFGAQADLVHINQLFEGNVSLKDYHILALPGGFTYGDDIEAGRILANELRLRLGDDIVQFINDGKLIIGICNGFQILVKTGFLPGPLSEQEKENVAFSQKVTLMGNDSAKFEDRWTFLRVNGKSVWTKGLKDVVYFPVAHAEGKFMPQDEDIMRKLKSNGQIIFSYCGEDGGAPGYPENPNGSVGNVAGITDITGRILGLMPHPERHFYFMHHPYWTRLKKNGQYGDGAKIFENGVNYIKKEILA